MAIRANSGGKFLAATLAFALAAALGGCGGGGGGTAATTGTGGSADGDASAPGASVPAPAPALPLMVDSLGREVAEAAFGGGDPLAAGIDGIAYDVAPMGGAVVSLTAASGYIGETTADATGYYRFNAKGLTPPFKVSAQRLYYSYTSISTAPVRARGFLTMNVTGLTEKIASDVSERAGRGVYGGGAIPAVVTANPGAVAAARGRVVAGLDFPLANAGLDAATYDPVSTPLRSVGPDRHLALLREVQILRLPNAARTLAAVDLAGTTAAVNAPAGIAADGAGTTYVLDAGIRILKISPAGVASVFAGEGATGAGAAVFLKSPTALAVDAAGNVYVADGYDEGIVKISPAGEGTVLSRHRDVMGAQGIAVATDGTVFVRNNSGLTKVTSAGVATFLPGTAFQPPGTFDAPRQGIAADGAGNFYVSSPIERTVYKVSSAGFVTLLYKIPASLFTPSNGLAADGSGALYMTDTADRIWKIPEGGRTITLLAGGDKGYADGTGAAARFSRPSALAVDGKGNLMVADRDNNAVRKVTPSGEVSTLRGKKTGFADGSGRQATFGGASVGGEFVGLSGVALDAAGDIVVADTANHAIRRITRAGVVSTLAGNGVPGASDGTGRAASFDTPLGVAVDAAGNTYVADSRNNAIRKISPTGVVTTLAGGGGAGSDDGTGPQGRFSAPTGISIDRFGNLYVADVGNAAIRKVTPAGAVSTLTGNNARNPAAGFTRVFGTITVDSEGLVRFTGDSTDPVFTSAIYMVSASAGVSRRHGFRGPESVPAGGQLAIDGQGILYYTRKTDGYANNRHTIFRLTPAEAETVYADDFNTGFDGRWFAVDANGHLITADKYNAAVRVYLP